MSTNSYYWPGRVHIGAGSVLLAGSEAIALGVSNAFVLVDPFLTELAAPMLGTLREHGVVTTTFTEIVGNPSVSAVDAAVAAFRGSGADCVIGFGGGSALDMAKAVRLMAGAPADHSSRRYMSGQPDALPTPPTRLLPPMIAVPTTAGTGSEVTPWGVITDHDTNLKGGIGGFNTTPSAALIDPQLTLGLPPFLTAATGMDALSHLIEAYVSTYRNPVLDPLILRGIKLIADCLPVAFDEPTNEAARLAVMEAAMLGGIAISSNFVGACHSLAHQLSTFADMHHGLACALMLPPQMRFSAPAAPTRYAEIAAALGGTAAESAAEILGTGLEAADLVAALNKRLDLPANLKEAGIAADLLPVMTKQAMKDSNYTTNPRPVTEADMLAMYEAGYDSE